MTNKALALGLAALALLGGCLNASTLQTARVVPRGDDRFSIGAGATVITGLDFPWPYLEATYRYGIWENIDVGAFVSVLGTSGLDAKVQLLADDHFVVSTGLKFGTLQVTITTPDPDDPNNTIESSSGIAQLILPLYVSYDVASHLSLYASPKYLLNAASGAGPVSITHYAGSTLGLRLGDSWGLFLEGTALYGFNTSNLQLQGNVAIYWSPEWL